MINAKLAYLLSTCHKFSDAFFSPMIKQHESNKTVATRHHFTLYVDLCENESDSAFAVKNVYFKFANSDDSILADTLQSHNNEILSETTIRELYKNLPSGLELGAYNLVALYTIASLIKLYAGFKYVFIPVVINYGRGSGVSHQTALIIDYAGSIMYYEPYGTYEKFNKSYKVAMCELFSIFGNLNLINNSIVKCRTYHEHNGLFITENPDTPEKTEGIQQIILNKNNARSEDFDREYAALITELKKEFPDYNFEEDVYTDSKQDKTFKILDLLFRVDRYETTREIYKKLLRTALKIYCCYNSKTCVTITLVEMNEFFKGGLDQLYEDFNTPNTKPNIVLMDKLNKLLEDITTTSYLKDTVTQIAQSHKICKIIFT